MKSVEGIMKGVSSLLFGAAVLLWWGYVNPHILSFQEQYQLFLCTGDYFWERLSLPGGLADYLGEFITQFYFYPWVGATLLALLFMLIQGLSWMACGSRSYRIYAISFLPPVLLLAFMGDENLLLSYVVSGCLALLSNSLMNSADDATLSSYADLIVVPLLYWLIGPMAWMYVCLRVWKYPKKWWGIFVALLLITTQLVIYSALLQQWPLENTFLGVTYYRVPYMLPNALWLWPLITVFLIATTYLLRYRKQPSNYIAGVAAFAVVAIVGVFVVKQNYDEDKYEIVRLDYLVRGEKWDEIIRKADSHQLQHPFASQCVNLALAMKRQLAERMFDFYQSGEEALIMPPVHDMVTNFPTAEIFLRLGMVNSAQRYFSDIQESILSYRKSGRCTQRIVECLIVNGKYEIASKHIDLLKQSLFYKDWAKDAERYLNNDPWVDNHPSWGKLRKYRYKDDFLYNYDERDKMFGLLFINNPENKMALDYLMAQMLLNGNVQGFMEYMSWVQQYGGYKKMPAGYADAVKCIQAKGNVTGSSYAAYVKKMTAGKTKTLKEDDTAH